MVLVSGRLNNPNSYAMSMESRPALSTVWLAEDGSVTLRTKDTRRPACTADHDQFMITPWVNVPKASPKDF